MDEPRYWNPILETMPRDKLVEIQIRKFNRVLAHAVQNSPMYGEKLKDFAAGPATINSVDDLLNIPLTEKPELREAQECEGPYLYGQTLGPEVTDICTMHQTSGTTGRPLYVPDSYRSWQWRVEPWTSMLYMMGLRETDRVFIPFGYNIYVAFWSGHYASEKLGCEIVPGGALDTKARIEKMREVRATVTLNTPTYGLHMGEVAKEMGIDPGRDLTIRKMVCAGEPLPEPTRRKLENLWHADVYNHIGSAETCGWAGMCTEKRDLHILEPYYLVELLDQETMSRHVAQGEPGVAVITPLFYRSFPLIRFNSNDLMVLSTDDCPCGRTSLRIDKFLGRVDELRKIRGVLFSPLSVEEVIFEHFPEIREYEIVVTRPASMDELTLRVEGDASLGKDDLAGIESRLQERLKTKTNLRFELAWVEPGGLPRYTLKAKRFKDLREG